MPRLESFADLNTDADRCVKCGLCLPHCPTYAETAHEGNSPRGRIALLQGLTSGLIPLTPAGERHLDTCLGCRSCEQVCPAQVPYGRLLDRGREWMALTRPGRTIGPLWLGRVLALPWLRRIMAIVLWLYQRIGLSRLLRASARFRESALGRLEGLLPVLSFPRIPGARARSGGTQAGTVRMFYGCMGEWAERDVALAVIALLEASGHRVDVPRDQQCCGALFLHAGLPEPARALQRRNARAFAGESAVVTLASGCARGLRDIEEHSASAGTRLGPRLSDPLSLLAASDELRFARLDARVAVQVPCTQRLLPEGSSPVVAALERIPGVEIVLLKTARSCCGAAGSYFISQPLLADQVLDATLDAVEAARAKILVSGNIGCRLHLEAGLRRRGLAVEVVHPAVLLHRQWLATRSDAVGRRAGVE